MDESPFFSMLRVMELEFASGYVVSPLSSFDQPSSSPLFFKSFKNFIAVSTSSSTNGPTLVCLRYIVCLGKSNVTKCRAKISIQSRLHQLGQKGSCRSRHPKHIFVNAPYH